MRTKANKDTVLALFLASVLTGGFGVTAVLAHSGDIIVALSGSTPIIDGSIEAGEWDDANNITISVTGGQDGTVYVKQNGVNLYVAFSIPDATYNGSDSCFVIFDVEHDGNTLLQTDDIWLSVSRAGANKEYNVTAGGWYLTTVSGWTAKANSTPIGWQSEYNITYSKLDVTVSTNKTLGVEFLSLDKDVEGWYAWPFSSSITSPVTWGDMVVVQGFPPDTTPPTLSIISPENKAYTVNSIPLTFTISETASWIGYSLDSQTNVTISGNTTINGLSDGVRTIIIYANDTAGNIGYSATVYFMIDTLPPNIELLSPENKTYTTNSVTLSFTVDETTSSVSYSLDGQANVAIDGNTTLSELSDGAHSLVVYANDTAGNTGASEMIYFTIETQQAELFPTWIVAALVVIAGVGVALLVYFAKVKKTTKSNNNPNFP